VVKIKNPLFSFKGEGKLGSITFLRRRKVDVAEKTPVVPDQKTAPQLAWRHMYQKCAALWGYLSAAEKADWDSRARSKHMTGFAYWQSQCLKPNPGIYLPLQGGTMQGDIDMAKFRLLELPSPTDVQEAATKAYVDARIAFHAALPNVHHVPPTTRTIATGTYTGDGTDDRQITVGFKCSFVVLQGRTTGEPPNRWTIIPNKTVRDTSGSHNTATVDALLHATNGFVVDELMANINAQPYYYWAISE